MTAMLVPAPPPPDVWERLDDAVKTSRARREEDAPTAAELIDAWKSPGLLIDQPAVQRLMRQNSLRLIQGGDDAA